MAGEITSSSAPSLVNENSPCSCCCSSQIVSLSNAHHFITIKLGTPTNYPFWRTQITLFLEGQNLMGFVDGTHQRPPPTHSDYAQWVRQDRLIMSLLISSLSEDVFPKVIGLETSHDVWVTLEKALDDGQVQSSSSVTQMDPILYESAQSGKLDVFRQNKDQIHAQRTPNSNTLLHVLAQFHDSAECVHVILDKQSSSDKQSMLTSKNSKGETALHIAAQSGHCKIVRALIERAKALHKKEEIESGINIAEEMMRATDKNGDTAIHMVVRNKHAQVVQILVEEEDPYFSHPWNKMEETPLYLAVESDCHAIVELILKTCKSPGYKGPANRTAFHAAVLRDCQDCIAQLLGQIPGLTKEVDENGWSPLHYAARFNRVSRAIELLEVDRSAAYIIASKDDNQTPLHMAARQGCEGLMEELLKYCPDCWEMTTSEGQNILHLAVGHGHLAIMAYIRKAFPWMIAKLINEKDAEGNTPLHLYVTKYGIMGRLVQHFSQADKNAYNAKNLTPLDVLNQHANGYLLFKILKRWRLKRSGGELGYRDIIPREHYLSSPWKGVDRKRIFKSQIIVATLIATVTFAAGFTMPGGYVSEKGPNQGMTILSKKTAFQAFVVSDTVALVSSFLVIIIHFASSILPNDLRFFSGGDLIIIAITAMMVAFVTGLYAVVDPSLGITACFVGALPLLICGVLYYICIIDELRSLRVH